MKHTALPWKHTGNNQSLNNYAEMIHGQHRTKPVASCPLENHYHQNEAIANAEFIVKACNCHEELVEAIEWVINYGITGPGSMKKLRDVLANATK